MEKTGDYEKSRLNRVVEKAGLRDLLLKDKRFQAPSRPLKLAILRQLGLGDVTEFGPQSFDAIMTSAPRPPVAKDNLDQIISDLVLVEMKTTKKAIKDESLAGFFFGATQREYHLAERLGSRFRFAFVVLNSDNDYGKPFAVLLTLDEVERRTRSKRIQFQVNLWSSRQSANQSTSGLLIV